MRARHRISGASVCGLEDWKVDYLFHGKKPDMDSGFKLKFMIWNHSGIDGSNPNSPAATVKKHKNELLAAFKRDNPNGKPFFERLL